MGGENEVSPNREIVFRVCVCVACVRACVRAKLCEGPRVKLFRVSGPWPAPERTGRKPSIPTLRMCPRLGPRLSLKKGPKVGPQGPPSAQTKSSYHACVALWIGGLGCESAATRTGKSCFVFVFALRACVRSCARVQESSFSGSRAFRQAAS